MSARLLEQLQDLTSVLHLAPGERDERGGTQMRVRDHPCALRSRAVALISKRLLERTAGRGKCCNRRSALPATATSAGTGEGPRGPGHQSLRPGSKRPGLPEQTRTPTAPLTSGRGSERRSYLV